jgi:uncharacterized protein (DUF433 family)
VSRAPHFYDRVKWHDESTLEAAGLPLEHVYVYAGFYLAWAAERGLTGGEPMAGLQDAIAATAARRGSPIDLYQRCGGELVDDMLTEAGKAFSDFYLEDGRYFDDLVSLFGEEDANAERIAPTWENYDRIKPVIDKRYKKWLASPPVDPLSRITVDPAVCLGKPCIRGLPHTVTDVLLMLASEWSREELLAQFPDLEAEDFEAALLYAADALDRPATP